ncbi:orotidine-5'-phosphate decarboxylase [Desulfosoma caldarium]|uniref:Orotidine 5'-phosphate decarboxylase n=1 Tax=Desulfosoma caldarium TaxID=610254 RepID=A0A3N1UW11_9BACT|nr:orotidine-5'-phosphate decarboxylase [Desulfosoma caldarium]ROQ93609.1 orotidine-5'-phosphate decarboxylase [Desulfosoma caldarium]
MDSVPLRERLIFALDLPSPEDAKAWVERLEDQVRFFKVGFELFLAGGFPIVEWIQNRGAKVFLDLKLFDVPETVRRATAQIAKRHVALTTVHGNDAMLKAAVDAKGPVKILAVTALTSLDQGDLHDLGFHCTVEDLVLSRARRALALGCDGLISSGLEIPRVRREVKDGLLLVVPGIRPVANVDDQKRTVDPRQAFASGADHIVVGRPIRNAAHPERLVEEILEQIEKGLRERARILADE